MLTASSTFSGSVTSTICLYKFLCLIFLTIFFSSFSSLSQIITFAPDLRNLFVISKPKPCAPPVTIATFFFKSNLFIFHLLAGNRQYLKQQNQLSKKKIEIY